MPPARARGCDESMPPCSCNGRLATHGVPGHPLLRPSGPVLERIETRNLEFFAGSGGPFRVEGMNTPKNQLVSYLLSIFVALSCLFLTGCPGGGSGSGGSSEESIFDANFTVESVDQSPCHPDVTPPLPYRLATAYLRAKTGGHELVGLEVEYATPSHTELTPIGTLVGTAGAPEIPLTPDDAKGVWRHPVTATISSTLYFYIHFDLTSASSATEWTVALVATFAEGAPPRTGPDTRPRITKRVSLTLHRVWCPPPTDNGWVVEWQPDFSSDTEIIRVVPNGGSGYDTIPLTDNVVDDQDPSWSQDRAKVVFVRKTSALGATNTSQIYEINFDGTGETPINVATTNGTPVGTRLLYWFRPEYSADGNKLYALCTENDQYAARRAYCIDLATGAATSILQGISALTTPRGMSPSPYGGTIVLSAWTDLYTSNGVNEAGTSPLNMPNMMGYGAPEFSPDGARIIYIVSDLNTNDAALMTADPNGTNATPFALPTIGAMYSPSWSPDGTSIAVTEPALGTSESNIHIIRAVTGTVVDTATIPGFINNLDW